MANEIVIGDTRYKINLMRSDIGGWLLMKLIGSMRKAGESVTGNEPELSEAEKERQQTPEFKQQACRAMIQFFLETADRKLFAEVQKEALGCVAEYAMLNEKEVELPILLVSGKFNKPELNTAIASVMRLTSESLFVNLSPFFLENGLNG